MTTFFKCTTGGYVAASEVTGLEEVPERGNEVLRARLRNGTQSFVTRQSVEQGVQQVIPPPATIEGFVIMVDIDTGDVWIEPRPLIGFGASGGLWFPIAAGVSSDMCEVVFADTRHPDVLFRRGDSTPYNKDALLAQVARERTLIAATLGSQR